MTWSNVFLLFTSATLAPLSKNVQVIVRDFINLMIYQQEVSNLGYAMLMLFTMLSFKGSSLCEIKLLLDLLMPILDLFCRSEFDFECVCVLYFLESAKDTLLRYKTA